MALEMTWVVLTGMPNVEAPKMIVAAVVSAAKPWTGSSLTTLRAHGADDPPAAGGGAERDGAGRQDDDPQRHLELRDDARPRPGPGS